MPGDTQLCLNNCIDSGDHKLLLIRILAYLTILVTKTILIVLPHGVLADIVRNYLKEMNR